MNFHILTCTNPNCPYLKPTETSKGKEKAKEDTKQILPEHNTSALTKFISDKSYNDYPKKDNELWQEPFLDHILFYVKEKHEASFQKQIPTTIFDELAEKAKEYTCSANAVKTNSK